MAVPLRMMRGAATPVCIASVGPFGARVARLLAESLPAHPALTVAGPDDLHSAFERADGPVIVALWRPEPRLCDIADDLAFRRGLPWLPIVMEHPVIRVGPLVCPPAGPCFGCYARRRVQHDRDRRATAALEAAYEHDQACGPAGYLPHHARLVAAIAHDKLYRLAAAGDPGAAGEVTTVRLAQGGQTVSNVVACHDCSRCGGHAAAGEAGWLAELAASLSGVGADEAGVDLECATVGT